MAPSKRGLGWPYDNLQGAFKPYEDAIHKNDLTWLFNWEMWKPNGLPAALNYIPQVRTAAEAPQIDQYLSTIAESGHISHFIGFNEPDNTSQANLAVPQAVALWNQHVLPAKKKFGFRLGSPAITSAPSGKKWLQDFLHALNGHAEIDFIVVHWYGVKVDELKAFVQDIHKTFGKPVWLNEFACTDFGAGPQQQQPSLAHVEAFEREALRFLDGADYVARYAWFGAATHQASMGGVAAVNKLANGDKLTAVGSIYCAPSSQPHLHIDDAAATANNPSAAAGIHLTNHSKHQETYYFFNNNWNGNGTAGANFDHPETPPTTLAPGESRFVALPLAFKGRVQRGKLIPATWAEFQLSSSSAGADNNNKAWGDISLEQGYDGPAMIRATDGSGVANGFRKDILAGAPAAARQKRSDGKECIASTVGNWMGGRNQAAIEYEKKVVGQRKAYIQGGEGTDVVSSKNHVLGVDFY